MAEIEWPTYTCECGMWIQGGRTALIEHQRIVCRRDTDPDPDRPTPDGDAGEEVRHAA